MSTSTIVSLTPNCLYLVAATWLFALQFDTRVCKAPRNPLRKNLLADIDRFTSALVIPCLDHCHVPESEMPHSLGVDSVSQADIDQLSVTVQEKSWEQICTVSQLRRRLKSYELLRKVLSSLWLAVIYVSVQRSGLKNIMLQLQQAKELGVRGPKEMMSKYCRAGRAAWRVMSELDSGVLALVDLTAPVSNQTLEEFLFRTELCSEGILYRQQIYNVFVYLDEFLIEKQIDLFDSFSPSLKDIRDQLLRMSIHSERQVNEPHRGLAKALVSQEFWADGAEQELVYFCDKNRNSRTSKLGSLWSVKSEDIGIPKSVAEALKQYHYHLLRQPSKNGVDLQSPADHYEFTCSIETGRTLDRILWRFLTTLYYDLVSELDATKHRFSATRDGGFAFVVAVICRSGKHDPDTVRGKVIDWAKVGQRYRGFMNVLCSGCLILFPEKTSDLVWEQYMPIKGEIFDKAIQFLQGLGIVNKCKEEGWNDVSDKILQTLWVPFRSLIPFQFQPSQQYQMGWAANSSKNGLIKIKAGAVGQVRDFYVRSICAGRTLLKDNAYIDEVLPLIDSDRATNLIATALTCSYYKEYLLEGSEQKEKIKRLETQSLVQAMALFQQKALDTTRMLIIHHAIINPEMHKVRWTDYLYQLQDSGQASLVIAAHAIWLMAILPLTDKYRFQTYDYSWVGYGEENYLTKVHGIVGTSRKMVYFQHLVRVAAKSPDAVNCENFLRQIAESQQWVDLIEERMPTRIALKTAETYKLATQLYALVRLYRFTPNHPYVRQICYRFTRTLCELPASGDEYSGLHPAWCFLIACACTDDREEYEKLYGILEYIGGVNKSNVLSLTRLVSWVWEWKNGRGLSAGWWEEMTEYLDSKMGGKLICVT